MTVEIVSHQWQRIASGTQDVNDMLMEVQQLAQTQAELMPWVVCAAFGACFVAGLQTLFIVLRGKDQKKVW